MGIEVEISVAKIGGYWRVLWNGKVVRTFTGPDAHSKACGCAMAMSDGRELR